MGIRMANLNDTPQLMELFDGSLRNMAALQPWQWRVVPQKADFVQAAILEPNGMLYVWEEDGRLLGLVSLFLKAQEESDVRLPCRYVDLDTLYVRPEAKGRGIGTALYQAACQWAKEQGADRVELMTLGENRDARAFYAHMGMQEQSIILTQTLT